ncbi:hypothetical protein VTN31DRAFT_323 [Thermomyces dupontii]|uniref:uncharacterized protein n=1 Tax=Talaromyces thermophilus TaxID=28565 RepID=UPI0037438B4C
MNPPKLSYGLNLPNSKKPPTLNKPNLAAGQKRKKTIFDEDDDSDSGAQGRDGGIEEITTLGGLGEDSAPSAAREEEEEESETSKKPSRPGLPAKPPNGKLGMKPIKKNSIFADDSDDDKEEEDNDAGKKKKKYGLQFSGSSKDYVNLAAMHTAKKQAEEAKNLDPSIYAYDDVYDSMKATQEQKKKEAAAQEQGRSRYMEALQRSAEIRKRDHLRAHDRKLQREREAEGDAYADKEKFVTAAYRAQQEELRRLEEEEARREKEEEERRRKSGGTGLVSFYRDMLARSDAQHGEAIQAAEEAAAKVAAGEKPTVEHHDEEAEKEKTPAQIAAELNTKGKNIAINDEGEVVDKRQLLSAGLNVAPKKKTTPSQAAPTTREPGSRPPGASAATSAAARFAQRARQTEMLAKQLEERARQEQEAEEARQRELAEKLKSRKTEAEVSSARERYLARKRERELQAKNQQQ